MTVFFSIINRGSLNLLCVKVVLCSSLLEMRMNVVVFAFFGTDGASISVVVLCCSLF